MTITKNRHHSQHSNHRINLYDDVEKIKEALKDTTLDVKDKAIEMLNQTLENAKETSSNIQDKVTDYVSDKPFKSLGAAVLAGMLIGYFFHK